MTIRIRGAEAGDVDVLIQHAAKLTLESEGLQLDPEQLRAGVEASLTDPAKAIYFIAEDNGAVVGSLFVSHEWSDWNNGWYWWIQGVYVDPSARRTGVYTALYDAVRSDAKARGNVCSIRLYVHEGNPARAAYEAHGMEPLPYVVYEGKLD